MPVAVPSRLVLALALVALGIAAGLSGIAVLRSFGSGVRVGRLLSVTPIVTIEEALAAATTGEGRYLGVEGRIDATDEFTDEHDRPLVFRRTRLEMRTRGRWRTIDDTIERVPFSLDAGPASIAIDVEVLGPGLVVLPRESEGTAGEIPDRVPPGTPAGSPARLRVEQVSSVEHATALGCPQVGPDGSTRLTAAIGRPLVLTTLERDEAMRVLAGGRRRRAIAAAALLIAAPVLVAAGLLAALLGGLI